jgi:pimeloyl-ACP methyl ester carboxylesterase
VDDSFLDPPGDRPSSSQPAWPNASMTAPKTNGKATWSLVLGIVSVACFCGGFLAGIPAIVLGFAGKRDVALSGGAESGRGIAIGGIVTGIIGTVISALFLAIVGVSMVFDHHPKKSGPWTPPTPAATTAPANLQPFYDQKLQWRECGDSKCAHVTVPVDYDHPDGQTLSLALKVLPATGHGGRSLFLNPGGPGASGMDFVDYMSGLFGDRVRARYDLVGVDPRGVGASTPLDCLSDGAFDRFTASDPDPDSPAEIEASRELIENFGRGCEKRSGALAAHVSTEEAARDFDIVRALLGESHLDWFGASYGTQLGATYATLFPQRVGRMVLDGAVDPSLSGIRSSLGQTTGFERALRAYVKDCVKRRSCPLGRTVDPAIDRIAALLQSMDKRPLKTVEHRKLTEGLAFYGMVVTLYNKSTWGMLSQALDSAFKGDGSVLLRLSDYYFDRRSDGSYEGNLGESFPAIGCLDSSDRPTLEEVEAAEPDFIKASPPFGRIMAWGAYSCTDWPIPVTHPQIPISAPTAAPIVVIGTTRDPATPYEWSKALTRQLGGSAVLLSREGDGHTAYASGDDCIQAAVDAYLVDGTVPKRGTLCD